MSQAFHWAPVRGMFDNPFFTSLTPPPKKRHTAPWYIGTASLTEFSVTRAQRPKMITHLGLGRSRMPRQSAMILHASTHGHRIVHVVLRMASDKP